jgi:RNA polymerase sigma-70 factor (ECF subfamily)
VEKYSRSLISSRIDEWWKAVTENQAPNELRPTKAEEPKDPASVESNSESPILNAERWVENYGDVLFGFAAARVRDHAIAQDLVQETFLAALKAKAGFAGRSTERTWLFGILRNKLVDYYRLQSREVSLGDDETVLPEEQGAFNAKGFHKDAWDRSLAPKPWETPDKSLSNQEFQGVLKTCLSKLPDRIAQVFKLREIDGLSTDEICNDLGVSSNNLCVMLHRARMSLRHCLEVHWFGDSKKKEPRGSKANTEGKVC